MFKDLIRLFGSAIISPIAAIISFPKIWRISRDPDLNNADEQRTRLLIPIKYKVSDRYYKAQWATYIGVTVPLFLNLLIGLASSLVYSGPFWSGLSSAIMIAWLPLYGFINEWYDQRDTFINPNIDDVPGTYLLSVCDEILFCRTQNRFLNAFIQGCQTKFDRIQAIAQSQSTVSTIVTIPLELKQENRPLLVTYEAQRFNAPQLREPDFQHSELKDGMLLSLPNSIPDSNNQDTNNQNTNNHHTNISMNNS